MSVLKLFSMPRKAVRFWTALKEFKLLQLDTSSLIYYMLEHWSDITLRTYMRRRVLQARAICSDPRLGGWVDPYTAGMIYALVRVLKPETVVETGVGPGSTTAVILRALDANAKGTLYSIDLPGHDAKIYPTIGRQYNIHVPTGFEVGWLVPPWLKKRWRLILGDSAVELPNLLPKLGYIDMFLHDSLHTDEHIRFELATVLPHVRRRGVLMADDVNDYWSTAFVDFCKEHSLPFLVFRKRLGVAALSLS